MSNPIYDTLQETGHPTMLDRVKACHRMVTALTDEWEHRTPEKQPKWIRNGEDRKFWRDMFDKFDMWKLEEIVISKAQYFYLKDMYDRSL